MMTVGRDVEEPITRLAQKARAARHASHPGDAAAVGRRHHRPHQGELPGAHLVPGDGARRLAHHPRLASAPSACSAAATCLYMPPGTARGAAPARRLVSRGRDPQGRRASSSGRARRSTRSSLLEGRTTRTSEAPERTIWTTSCTIRRCGWSPRAARPRSPGCSAGLRVGYNRAARMIERMEREGVVTASEGGRPREVLGTADRGGLMRIDAASIGLGARAVASGAPRAHAVAVRRDRAPRAGSASTRPKI